MNSRTSEDRARYIKELAYQVEIGHIKADYAKKCLNQYDAYHTIEPSTEALRRPNPHLAQDTFKKEAVELIYPKMIFNKLQASVIGQTEAKKLLASVIANYLNESALLSTFAKAPRIALIGPTGCGKTHTLQSLNDTGYIDTHILNVAKYNGTGCKGDNLLQDVILSDRSLFHKQLKNKLNILLNTNKFSQMEIYKELYKTVLVFDEFDKIALQVNSGETGWGDLKMTVIMEILDGIEFTVRHGASDSEYTLNTKHFPMVFLGACSRLEEHEQTTPMTGIGFGASKNESNKVLLKTTLGKYGFMPELLGRITSIIKLDKLSKAEYTQILDTHVLSHFIKQFKLYNTSIMFDTSFKEYIAEQAEQTGEGARSLFELVEKEIRDKLFDIEDDKGHYIIMSRSV